MPKPGRRVVVVTLDFLERMISARPLDGEPLRYVTSTAPDDIRLTGHVEFDWNHRIFRFLCESSEWDEVEEGECIPDSEVLFIAHYENEDAQAG